FQRFVDAGGPRKINEPPGSGGCDRLPKGRIMSGCLSVTVLVAWGYGVVRPAVFKPGLWALAKMQVSQERRSPLLQNCPNPGRNVQSTYRAAFCSDFGSAFGAGTSA